MSKEGIPIFPGDVVFVPKNELEVLNDVLECVFGETAEGIWLFGGEWKLEVSAWFIVRSTGDA